VRELERERVTVQEAARQLGIPESALRKRAQRGQLQSQKVTEGKKVVYSGPSGVVIFL
jgi:DNA-directed RNA polymerase specialized sigma24 family protein